MDAYAFNKLIQEKGLEEYKNELIKYIYPSVRLIGEPLNEDEIPLGSSKIGGRPDVPNGFTWPKSKKNKYFSFICQLNCKDFVNYKLEDIPRDGILYFFYPSCIVFGGIDPLGTEALVFYVSNTDNLVRLDAPDDMDKNWIYSACKVHTKMELTLPPSESSIIQSLGIKFFSDKYWSYNEFYSIFYQKWVARDLYSNRFLGHPDQMQEDLQFYSSKIWNNMNEEKSDPIEWRLLLQIDSEYEKTGMMWGDSGKLYFMIRSKDLKKNAFHQCIAIYQC